MFSRRFLRNQIYLNYFRSRQFGVEKKERNPNYAFSFNESLEVCGPNLEFGKAQNKVSPKFLYSCYISRNSIYDNIGYSPKYPPVPVQAPELLKLMERICNGPENLPKDFQSSVIENIDSLSFEEFLEFMNLLHNLQVNMINCNEVIDAIMKDFKAAFKKRAKLLTVEEKIKCLSVLNRFYKFPFFLYSLMTYKISEKFKTLNSHQLVYTVYLISKLRQINDKKLKFILEETIFKLMPDLSPGDLGLICNTYYKFTQNFSHPEINEAILSKILSNIEETKSCFLTSICMLLKTAAHPRLENNIMNFQKEIFSHFSKFSVESSISVALISEKYNKVYSPLMDAVLDRVNKNIKTIHKSILISLFQFFVRLKYQNEEFLNAMLEEFKACDSKDLLYVLEFLCSLVHLQNFPEELISKVMNQDLIKNLIAKNQIKHPLHWQFLQCSLEIEKPHMALRDIDDIMLKLRKKRKLKEMLKLKNRVSYYLFKLEDMLAQLYGKEKKVWSEILPHYQGMIIMKFDKNLVAQEVGQDFKTKKGRIIRPLLDDHYFLSLCCTESFPILSAYEDYPEIGVANQTKLRQLKILGYEPLLMTLKEMYACSNSSELLTSKINAKLQEIHLKKNSSA